MPPVWSVPINSKERVIESHGYATAVHSALSGREQREQLRRHPIGGLEAEYLCDVAQHAGAAAAILYPNQKTKWIVPLWQYMNPLLIARSIGETQIDVDTTDVPFRDVLGFGDYALVASDPLTYEALTMTAVGSNFLTVSPLAKNWGTVSGVYVCPARVGRLTVVAYRWLNAGALSARLRFEFEPCSVGIPNATENQYILFDTVIPV